jgi:hypothetical protein
VSSTNKADSNDIAEILLKVTLNIMTVTLALESYLPDHMSSPSVFSLGSLSSILSFLVVHFNLLNFNKMMCLMKITDNTMIKRNRTNNG